MKLLLAGIMLLLCATAHARGPGWPLSMPIFKDDGDKRTPVKVAVSSVTPVSPYTPDALQDRFMILWNPNTDFDCMVGTFSAFTVNDSWWVIPRGSGTWSSSNHQQFWLLMAPGSSTTTIRGVVEKQ